MYWFCSHTNFFRSDRNKGFTFLEIMLVVGIMSVLFAFLLPNFYYIYKERYLYRVSRDLAIDILKGQHLAIKRGLPLEFTFYKENNQVMYFAQFSDIDAAKEGKVVMGKLPNNIIIDKINGADFSTNFQIVINNVGKFKINNHEEDVQITVRHNLVKKNIIFKNNSIGKVDIVDVFQ